MKRRGVLISLILCVSLLFCGNTGTLVRAGDLPVAWLETVPDRISWDDINAIPVATPDMTEDELRQICVDFMLMQQSFTWTPTHDLDYSCTAAGAADENGLLHCKVGQIYAGLPYGSGGLSLYNAMDLYDPETGELDAYALQDGTKLSLSNNCATAYLWGIARVCTSLTYESSFGGTVTMTQKNGFIPLGPYTYDSALERYDVSDETRTKKICEQNGQQTMFESYALMQKADGMVVYTQNSGGHARMVKEDAVVVRKSNGSIDGDNSYVIAIEQFSAKSERQSEGRTVYQHGEIDKKYTFSALYKSGYLPFTIAEFTGDKAVEPAHASLTKTGSKLSYKSLRSANIKSNYIISKVTVTVTGADGSVKEQLTKHLSVTRLYKDHQLVNTIPSDMTTSGHVTIDVTVGSGQTLRVYEGEACYDESGAFHSAHNYQSVITEPTCTEKGYTTYTCSRCGNTYVADEVGPLGILWGDANGDGKVTNVDIVRLKKYLANYDEETGTSTVELFPGADANGDGAINNQDIVRLKNYLANFDDVTGLSTVTLGPDE